MNNPRPTNIKKIYFIAGESSGDRMGSSIIKSIKKINPEIQYVGIGGQLMQKAGIKSLFDIKQISLMGFLEILPHLFRILKLINLTVKDILKQQPDIIVTIDAPGFCYQVIKKLHKIKPSLYKIHIVAPSVWVYKPSRAKKFAAIYDNMLTLLPFEPIYFHKEGMDATYIGHPVFEQKYGGSKEFRKKHNLSEKDQLIVITPGSRSQEIKRHMPIFIQTIELLTTKYPKIKICFTLINHADLVKKYLKYCNFEYIIATEKERLASYESANVAIAKSGTNTLEFAASKTAMVVAYKLNSLTYFLIKIMAKIKYASLINIIANKAIIPEFLQSNCDPILLYEAIDNLLLNKKQRQKQIDECQAIIKTLGFNNKSVPSTNAARIILEGKL